MPELAVIFGRRTVEALINAVERGASDDTAARAAGVRPSDLRAFLALADEDGAPYGLSAMAREVLSVRAGHATRSLDVMTTSSDYRAHAWLLERVHGYRDVKPSAEPVRVEVTSPAVDDAIAALLARGGVDALRRAVGVED